MKVINAGYPKSGTKSLTQALRMLEYDKVYDYEEAIEFGFEEWEKILNNESCNVDEVIEKVYSDGVEAVVDLPHSFFFEKFFRRWPDAKVILTVRDEEKQYHSFRNMMDDAMKASRYSRLLTYLSPTGRRFMKFNDDLLITAVASKDSSQLKWIECLRRHIAYVKSVVPKDQLLVFNVREGWEPLCKFLGKTIPPKDFPVVNKRGAKDTIADRVIDSKMMQQVRKEVLVALILMTALLCIAASFAIMYFGLQD